MINSIFEIVRKTPLRSIYRGGRRLYRNRDFRKLMREILSNPQYSLSQREILSRLSYAWANMSHSASVEYLEECIKYTKQSKLPILECGSGLSTIVIGLIAKKYGNTVWSLEHMKSWYKRTKRILEDYNISSVKLIYSPVVDYGGLVWYSPPLNLIPDKFSLIVCDGPAGIKKRAKHCIFPIMKERFASGCIILYDDADKVQTKDDILGWVKKLNMSYEIRGRENPYYIFKLL